MKSDNREQFYMLWQAAWEACGKSISSAALQLAFEALKHHDLKDVEAGIMAHVQNPQTGQYPPKPADVIRHIEGDPADKAMEAWCRVREAVTTRSPYDRLVFDDPRIHAALGRDGWATMMRAQSDRDLEFLGKDFRVVYGAVNPRNLPAVLCAIPQDIPGDIILIGDPVRAAEVYRTGLDDDDERLTGPQRLLQ